MLVELFFFFCLIFLLLYSYLNLPLLYVWSKGNHSNICIYCATFIWLSSNYMSSSPSFFSSSCSPLSNPLCLIEKKTISHSDYSEISVCCEIVNTAHPFIESVGGLVKFLVVSFWYWTLVMGVSLAVRHKSRQLSNNSSE